MPDPPQPFVFSTLPIVNTEAEKGIVRTTSQRMLALSQTCSCDKLAGAVVERAIKQKGL